MTRNEINALYLEAHKKGIKNKDIAKAIGCSQSLVSQFFNHKANMSPQKEKELRAFILDQPEYRLLKVAVNK
ncbi:hypothetical protein [Bacillus litorisediminis]|uniref:hypothetical protein n=1 Tax=Bacillus litorisediminis TaxID=2922713 RepID=UPI001FAFD9E3|nr:hypothetical protein [Bacillus litorisediminis]